MIGSLVTSWWTQLTLLRAGDSIVLLEQGSLSHRPAPADGRMLRAEASWSNRPERDPIRIDVQIHDADGTLIAFTARGGGTCGSAVQLWVVRSSGSALRKLSDCANYPSWAPDSKRVVFIAALHSGHARSPSGRRATGRAEDFFAASAWPSRAAHFTASSSRF